MAKEKPKREAKSLRSYLILSGVAAIFVGAIVFGGVRSFETAGIWAGITFIVALVAIATLALSVKDDQNDPDDPKLK